MEVEMVEQATPLTRHDLEVKLVRHCWTDEEFRKEFIADPAGTFVKYLQVPAANLPKITVHQEEAGSWHIVLPSKPSNAAELSEDDLTKVAGGVTWTVIPTAIGSAVWTVVISGVSASGVVSGAAGGW
jgi:hypothetical protein